MYFPFSFEQMLLGKAQNGSIVLRTSGKTQNLTAGEVGAFDTKTYSALSAAPSVVAPFYLAGGNWHTTDEIGGHLGYQTSLKGDPIHPKNITKFYKVVAKAPKTQIIQLGWAGSGNQPFTFECATNYYLNLQVKGNSVARFMNRQLNHIVPFYTGCCADDCSAGCTNDPVDPALVMKGWADYINNETYIKNFVRATAVVGKASTTGTASAGATTLTVASGTDIATGQLVYGAGIAPGTKVATVAGTTVTLSKATTAALSGGTPVSFAVIVDDSYTPVVYDGTNAATVQGVKAGLLLEVAYQDTKFGNCTFNIADHYELEPINLLVSIVNETGDPCADFPMANSADGVGVVTLQQAVLTEGSGETIVRDFILANRLNQEKFGTGDTVNSLRFREAEDDVALKNIDRNTLYDRIVLVYHTEVVDNRQPVTTGYQVKREVVVPTGTDVSAYTTLLQALIDQGHNGVKLETF